MADKRVASYWHSRKLQGDNVIKHTGTRCGFPPTCLCDQQSIISGSPIVLAKAT